MRKLAIVLGTLVLSVLVAQFAWAQMGGGLLLVDDDGSCWGPYTDILPIFTAALEEAGLVQVASATIRGQYEIYEVPDNQHGADLNKLDDYEVVIWFNGETCCSYPNCITAVDETNLGDYLDLGGKLFLSAQDYLNYYGDGSEPYFDGTFPYDYLKVSSCYTDTWQGTDHTAEGPAAPDPQAVTEGLIFQLEDPFAGKEDGLFIDWIVPIPEKQFITGEFYIDDLAGAGYAALSWKAGDKYEGARVFFTTICFAALQDEVGTDNTKGELMSRILSWMYGDYADYGDAPDPPYYTMYENYGARHINSDGIFEWLGEDVDLEFNSFQVDLDLFDDGVIFHRPYVPGTTGSVDVTFSVSDYTSDRYHMTVPPGYDDNLYAHGWFDWNQDGDWDDAGENVFCSVMHNPYDEGWTGNSQTYTIEFPVPADYILAADMWTRFRLEYHYSDNTYAMEHAYGEVEDYVIEHGVNVALSTFYASGGDGQATLYWTTESEVNNLGFYLLRSEADGQYVRVNQELISGHGTSEARNEYSYVDRGLVNGLTYSYKVVDVDLAGTRTVHGPITVTAAAQVPTSYALSQNYPNPFNAQTIISYAIPQDSQVSLKVFNVVGEEVRTLVDSHQSANTYQVTWNGMDADSKSVASGVYFCTLKAGDFSKTTKMVFLR